MMAAGGQITPSELSTAEEVDRLELENACRAALGGHNREKVIDLGTELASPAVQKLAQATAAFEFALAAAEREVG